MRTKNKNVYYYNYNRQVMSLIQSATKLADNATKHIGEASHAEKGQWIGWTINGMPPFLWALISITLFITAISVDLHTPSITAFVFGAIFFLVYLIAISRHGIGKSIPI